MNTAPPAPPRSPALLCGLFALLLCGCPAEGFRLSAAPRKPEPEQEDIVPVGGYEVLAGLWDTARSEGRGERPLRLLVQVEEHRLKGAAPPVEQGETEHALRVECQVEHRTCLGNWYDNDGRGIMTWRFGTDFASFTGSYEGERRGAAVGSRTWHGTLIKR